MKSSQLHRAEILEREQQLKMARSVQASVCGSTGKFCEWLETAKSKVPEVPHTWICGDCHLGDLGPLETQKARLRSRWVTSISRLSEIRLMTSIPMALSSSMQLAVPIFEVCQLP
jgi:hypothetical protein